MPEVLPTYLGNSDIEETDSTQFVRDIYGLHTFVRSYQGEKTQAVIDAFRATFTEGTADATYTNMYISKVSERTDRSWYYADVEFVGTIDGSEPSVETEDTISENTLQVFTQVEAPIPAEIDYLAPRSTYRYATKVKPTAPRYIGLVESVWPIQITQKRGIAGLFDIEDFNVEITPYMTQFERAKAGRWYRNTEVHELRLVQDLEIKVIYIPQ